MTDGRRSHPLVGAVVVNFRAAQLTLACVESLMRTRWSAERLRVLVVDNSDDVELAGDLARRFPAVIHRASGGNVGFAEACDIGMRHFSSVDYLALVNNDATVHPSWLGPLVRRLEDDPQLGAAVPKILFAPRFLPIRSERGGRVTSLTINGVDARARTHPGPGAQRRPDPGRLGRHELHVEAGGELLVPVPDAAVEPWTVVVTTDAAADEGRTITPTGPPVDVINNFGTELLAGGFGTDRCYRRIDDGSADADTDVFSFSGGGVLFRRAFLEDVGLFDPRFFTYYEDLDLGWRGKRRGWRYGTVAGSTLRHIHTATTVEGSALFLFHNERNRLLTVTRNGSVREVVSAYAGHARGTLGMLRHGVFGPPSAARTGARQRLRVRLLALVSALVLLPRTIVTRGGKPGRRIGRRSIGLRSQPFRGTVMAMDEHSP
jgi:hypothetical protein